jgi:hypothetical protein
MLTRYLRFIVSKILGTLYLSERTVSMKTKDIIDQLVEEPGINAKVAILEKYKDDQILRRALYMAESRRVKFYTTKLPEYVTTSNSESWLSLQTALFELTHITHRNVTGHAAIKFVADLLSNMDPDDAEILGKVILKDLRTNVGTSLINRVFPKLIEETPYMGAVPYELSLIENILKSGRAISQVKMDGQYANAIVSLGGDVEMVSRSGETYYLAGAPVMEHLKNAYPAVLNGELTIPGIPRYLSNGIITSLISIGKKKHLGEDVTKELSKFRKEKGMTYDEALCSITYTIWDLITVDEYFAARSLTPYIERLAKASEFISLCKSPKIQLIEYIEVTSIEQAKQHFKEVLARGEEGTVVKAVDGIWVNDKPKWQVKMKLEMDVDLKIIGFNMGSGKNAKVISSFNAISSDNKLLAKPQGLTEDMMQYVTDNQSSLLGKIIAVKCCGISQDKKGGYSLLYPYFKEFRNDKTEADSLTDIQRIEEMTKSLGK